MSLLDNFSEHGGGAWIDLPTNFTSLPAFATGADLTKLIGKELPHDKASAFLHEMTHHWCFDTPLGIALSLLKTRIIYGMNVVDQGGKNIEDDDVLDDLMRYNCTVELLRPITEGLALFAEHDARPDGLHFYSSPILQMFAMGGIQLFRDGVGGGEPKRGVTFPDDIASAARQGLENFRLTSEGVDRKSDLLTSSLDAGKSPYLAGYLTIKRILELQMRRQQKMLNSDQFLSYLRTYFFCDYGFIDAIFAPGHEHHLLNRIGTYVHKRLCILHDTNLTEALAAWDAFDDPKGKSGLLTLDSSGAVTSQLNELNLPGLMNDADAHRRGDVTLKRMIEWLNHADESNATGRAIKFVAAIGLGLRSLMAVTALDVTTQGGDGYVHAACGTQFGPFIPLRDDQIEGNYSLEYFHIPSNSMSDASRLVLLCREGRVMGVIEADAEREDALGLFMPILMSTEELAERLELMRALEAELRSSRKMHVARMTYDAYKVDVGVQRKRVVLFSAIASFFYEGDDWQNWLDNYGKTGLFDLTGRDPQFLRQLAAFSLKAPQPELRENVASILGSSEDADVFFQRCREIQKTQNAQFLGESENIVHSYI